MLPDEWGKLVGAPPVRTNALFDQTSALSPFLTRCPFRTKALFGTARRMWLVLPVWEGYHSDACGYARSRAREVLAVNSLCPR